MACLLQPECNFLHGLFRCKLLVEVIDLEVKITSMQGTHIFRRDQRTQLIKCTPWSTRLHPHHTIIKKMKAFLEVEGQMGPIPVPGSQFRPPCQIPTPTLERTMLQKKGREQHLRSLDQQPPNVLQHICPCQRPHQNLKMMHPYLQYQSTRALHGLAQAKYQVTYLGTEIGCSHQIIWTIAKKTRLILNIKL